MWQTIGGICCIAMAVVCAGFAAWLLVLLEPFKRDPLNSFHVIAYIRFWLAVWSFISGSSAAAFAALAYFLLGSL